MDNATGGCSDLKAAASPGQTRYRGGFGTPLPRWARIVIASVLLTTSAAAVVTHDLLALWNTRARLQIDAIHMAVAGVGFLPGAPERGVRAAVHSAALSGLSRSEIVQVAAAPDGMSFQVTLRSTARVLVLQFLMETDVDVTATARVRPHAAPSRPDSGPGNGPMTFRRL
jgi:hypothetical protein